MLQNFIMSLSVNLHFNFVSVSYCSSLIRGNNEVPSGHGWSRLFLSDKRNQDQCQSVGGHHADTPSAEQFDHHLINIAAGSRAAASIRENINREQPSKDTINEPLPPPSPTKKKNKRSSDF